jgi:hypothetical protein
MNYTVVVDASDWINVDADSEDEARDKALEIFNSMGVHDSAEVTIMHFEE